MPELPEVEITARLIGDAVRGVAIQRVRVAGLTVLKSFDPPIDSLAGRTIIGMSRRGKYLILEVEGDLFLLMHLMSAGRLQLYETSASVKDKTSRLLIGLGDGRELRLREFGTHQSCWAKLVLDVHADEAISTLGPEAWPDPPPLMELLRSPRPLHNLMRDQRVIAGIGRSWIDEILHAAQLSPFKRGDSLSESEADVLRRSTIDVLDYAVAFYGRSVSLPIPDKLPMPLKVHRRAGEPCPRCGTAIEAVYFEDHVMCYCPHCQTGGKVLKDRRLSRLLK